MTIDDGDSDNVKLAAPHTDQRQTRIPFTASVLRRRPAATPYLVTMTLFSALHNVHVFRSASG